MNTIPRLSFLLIVILTLFSVLGCSREDEDNIPPTIISVDVKDGSQVYANSTFTVVFSENMGYVKISISGAQGNTTLDSSGKKATWTPLSDIPVGEHILTIEAEDLVDNKLYNPKPIKFNVAKNNKEPISNDNNNQKPVSNGGSLNSELWYPGGIGSYWIYDTMSGQTKAEVLGNVVLGGMTYKSITEDEQFMSMISDQNGKEIGPFLTFRIDNSGKVLGYGVVINEAFEEIILQVFIEEGLGDIVQVQTGSDEWIILEDTAISNTWNVMSLKARADLLGISMTATFSIKGEIVKKEKLKIKAGQFDTIVIDYSFLSEVDGDISEDPFLTAWVSPNIGLIQMRSSDIEGSLIKYNVSSVNPAPQGFVGNQQNIRKSRVFVSNMYDFQKLALIKLLHKLIKSVQLLSI